MKKKFQKNAKFYKKKVLKNAKKYQNKLQIKSIEILNFPSTPSTKLIKPQQKITQNSGKTRINNLPEVHQKSPKIFPSHSHSKIYVIPSQDLAFFNSLWLDIVSQAAALVLHRVHTVEHTSSKVHLYKSNSKTGSH